MRIKHPRLEQNEAGQLVFFCPTQHKERNTESLYNIKTNELFMAGQLIETHPKFKNIDQFEDWCNRYWANH